MTRIQAIASFLGRVVVYNDAATSEARRLARLAGNTRSKCASLGVAELVILVTLAQRETLGHMTTRRSALMSGPKTNTSKDAMYKADDSLELKGYIESPDRGVRRLTERGRELVNSILR